jgi:hypothetical protein
MNMKTRSQIFFGKRTCFKDQMGNELDQQASSEMEQDSCCALKLEKYNCYEMERLTSDFLPGPNDVICGRGKDVLQHSGNLQYRELINASLRSYNTTKSRLEKTLLVSAIIKQVEDSCGEGGGFVKKVNGIWYKVSDKYAREKTGQRYEILWKSHLILPTSFLCN